jgi:aldehyde dehydrogenase (NAD+)
LENGSVIQFTGVWCDNATEWTEYYAGWADKLEGLVVASGPDEPFIHTLCEPRGVCALIVPWNGPLLLLGMKTAPALAAGNTLVIKPPEHAPFTSVRFVELAQEAGVPPGVINLVIGNAECGAALVEHPGIDKISFTGGPDTARRIMASAATNLTPALFELGGKGANLIFADADLDDVMPFAASFAVFNAGQSCASPTRMLVERSIYREVTERTEAIIRSLSLGDPLDPVTFMGPLALAASQARVLGVIERALSEKAGHMVLGGKAGEGELADGYFVQPTIFTDVDPNSHLAQNEVFGPVLSIIPFDTEEEALSIANGTAFGLSSYVQTGDARRARRLAAELRSGTISINGAFPVDRRAPFGGVGLSGFGYEGGRAGIDEFIHKKTVLIR